MTTITPIKPPEKAGITRIELGPVHNNRAERRGDVITLPDVDNLRYFSLMDGEQFVATIGTEGVRTFFGGTDEAPFLVELHQMHLNNLHGGEQAFYDGLKPALITTLEDRLGQGRSCRQGDIWFYDLQSTWDKIEQAHRKISGKGFIVSRRAIRLFDTRHQLNGGRIVPHNTRLATPKGPMGTKPASVGDGSLTAPDHASVTIDGPHVFARTPGILTPARLAD